MLERLFPTKYHVALKFLGGKKWIDLVADPEKGTKLTPLNYVITPEDLKIYSHEDMDTAAMLLRKYGFSDSTTSMYLLSVSQLVANGPKIFRPTFDQCLALENTEINIPIEYYQQPYPTVLIDIPKEYRERIRSVYGVAKAPSYVICYRHECGHIVVTAWFGDEDIIVNSISPRKQFSSIEESIVCNRQSLDNKNVMGITVGGEGETEKREMKHGSDPEFGVAELVQRLGINFSIMMTMFKMRVGDPINTTRDRFEKQTRIAANPKADPEDRQRARKLLTSIVFLTEFEQKIDFYDVEDERPTRHPNTTDIEVRPHCRKGHWRLQHFGTGNAQTKVIFIKPVLVRKDRFVGDLANTSVTYTEKKE